MLAAPVPAAARTGPGVARRTECWPSGYRARRVSIRRVDDVGNLLGAGMVRHQRGNHGAIKRWLFTTGFYSGSDLVVGGQDWRAVRPAIKAQRAAVTVSGPGAACTRSSKPADARVGGWPPDAAENPRSAGLGSVEEARCSMGRDTRSSFEPEKWWICRAHG